MKIDLSSVPKTSLVLLSRSSLASWHLLFNWRYLAVPMYVAKIADDAILFQRARLGFGNFFGGFRKKTFAIKLENIREISRKEIFLENMNFGHDRLKGFCICLNSNKKLHLAVFENQEEISGNGQVFSNDLELFLKRMALLAGKY